jgi:hypothetical protein
LEAFRETSGVIDFIRIVRHSVTMCC